MSVYPCVDSLLTSFLRGRVNAARRFHRHEQQPVRKLLSCHCQLHYGGRRFALRQLSPNSITPTFTETFPRGKLWTQIMKVGDVICVADFHDLCPRQVFDFVGNLWRTLSQSRRNGIWALVHSGTMRSADLTAVCIWTDGQTRVLWSGQVRSTLVCI